MGVSEDEVAVVGVCDTGGFGLIGVLLRAFPLVECKLAGRSISEPALLRCTAAFKADKGEGRL